MDKGLFQLDASLKEPLYLQLYQRFVTAIKHQQLKPEARIPSIRALASELNLSRGTVELTYQILISEGLFEARGAAGTFISQAANQLSEIQIQASQAPQLQPISESSYSTSQQTMTSPFQLGIPALDAFPYSLWNRLSTRVIRTEKNEALNYPNPQGDLGLRKQLVSYLAIARGVQCSPEQIFINSGYRASLWLITQTLLKAGDLGWYEDPGYFIARDFLDQMKMRLSPIPVDEHGLIVDAGIQKAPHAKFAIITPTHQSPTNVTLSLERRLALLHWASQNKVWVIEDDYDSEFHYQGRVQPTLKSLDSDNRVIYCGTFSKTLFPALRLSYIVVPTTHISAFHEMAQTLGNHAPVLAQKIVQQFIAEGHFSRHLRKMRLLYKTRRQYLIDALEQEFSGILKVLPQMGGMHIIAEILTQMPATVFVTKAKTLGITIQAIDHWYEKKPKKAQLLLGFPNIVSFEMAQALCAQLKTAFLNQ